MIAHFRNSSIATTCRILILILLLVSGAISVSLGQIDTVRMCTYNLLNYGNSANPVLFKNQRLQPILSEIRPTIQCFNEISTAIPGLLDTLLKVMPQPMEHCKVHNTVSTTQLDGLYWLSSKFKLLHDSIICSDVRDIVAYDLFWNYPDLAIYKDTVKLTVITAHLKSSNTSADALTRAGETQKVSAYLSSLSAGSNFIMAGDLNLYSSSEQAYQNLTTSSKIEARLFDPMNRPGNWNNSSSFADIHTQSPRTIALPDGGASGGLDSRFDFILVSDAVLKGSNGVRYIPSSYKAYGNDGLHFGKALTDLPANTAVSTATAQALYELSDHLPVYADLVFTPPHLSSTAISTSNPFESSADLIVVNPFFDRIEFRSAFDNGATDLQFQLYASDGRLIQRGVVPSRTQTITVGTMLQSGSYVLRLYSVCFSKSYLLTHN